MQTADDSYFGITYLTAQPLQIQRAYRPNVGRFEIRSTDAKGKLPLHPPVTENFLSGPPPTIATSLNARPTQ